MTSHCRPGGTAHNGHFWGEVIQNVWRPRALCSCIVSLSLVLSGCASPFTGPVAPPDPAAAYSGASMPYALAVSRKQEAAYRAKVIELAESERLLVNGLVVLGGILIFGRTANVHSSITNGLVGGGTLAYTLGLVNTDKRRSVVYIAGMQALQCANEAVRQTGANPDGLAIDLAGLATAIDAAGAKAGAVKGKVSRAGGVTNASTELANASRAVVAANTDIARANEAHVAGSELLDRQRKLGDQHIDTVTKIDTAVLNELQGMAGSIQSTPGILTQLVGNMSYFNGLGKFPAAAPTPSVEGPHSKNIGPSRTAAEERLLKELESAIAELSEAEAAMNARTDRLVRTSTRMDKNFSPDFLDKCKIEKVALALTVDKQVLTFTEKTADRQLVKVTGGKDNSYVVSFRSTVHPEVSLRQLDKGLWEISTSDKVAVNTAGYELDVKDLSNSDVTVLIRIMPKSASAASGTAATGTDTGSSTDLRARVRALSPLPLPSGTVVTFINVTVRKDGAPEITFLPKDGKAATSAEVVAAVKNQLGAAVAPVAIPADDAAPHAAKVRLAAQGKFGPVVKWLSPTEVTAMQKSLCMKPEDMMDGWGKRTQEALTKDRERREKAGEKDVPEGFIKTPEAKALLERAPDTVARYCKA